MNIFTLCREILYIVQKRYKLSMKKILIILVFFLLMNSALCNAFPFFIFHTSSKHSDYIIEDATPKDDAFHGINNKYCLEWWYFDVVFNGNHGIHIGLMVNSFMSWGFVREMINIYNNTNVEEKETRFRPLNQYEISEEVPEILHNYEKLMEFDYDEYISSGNWNYTLTLEMEKIKVDLKFIGKSKPFKYETEGEGWTVAQPKAEVEGIITINGEELSIDGTGYHDHNWNFSVETGIKGKGWYWGKLASQNYSLTWSKIEKTRFADDTISEKIGILSISDKDYIKIDSKNITFAEYDYEYHDGRFIPTKFKLHAIQDNLEINVSFTAVSIQRIGLKILPLHYWRYFISITGNIKLGENIDYFEDDIQIMECMKFLNNIW